MPLSALIALLVLAPLPVEIRIGATDITPPELLPLGGYTERHGRTMLPGGDPLYARTLVFHRGATTIAIVSLEMLTVPTSLYREVKKRLPDDVSLFLAAVHTHCAPDSQMLNERMTFGLPGIARFSPKWLDWYSAKIAGGILDTMHSPAIEARSLELRQSRVSLNRPRRRDGTPDPLASELDSGSRVLATEYAAHATLHDSDENHTRGDWPGAVGAATSAPVLVGAIGDVSPALDGPDTAARIKEFRDRLEAALRVRAKPIWRDRDGIRLLQEPIHLDPARPHPTFAKNYKIPEALAQTLVDKFAEPGASITAIRIGSLAIVGVPGEPTGALGLRIVAAGKRLGYKAVIVCSHVNGWIGYILAPDDYDRGGYEAILSFNGRLTGDRIVEASVATIRKLR